MATTEVPMVRWKGQKEPIALHEALVSVLGELRKASDMESAAVEAPIGFKKILDGLQLEGASSKDIMELLQRLGVLRSTGRREPKVGGRYIYRVWPIVLAMEILGEDVVAISWNEMEEARASVRELRSLRKRLQTQTGQVKPVEEDSDEPTVLPSEYAVKHKALLEEMDRRIEQLTSDLESANTRVSELLSEAQTSSEGWTVSLRELTQERDDLLAERDALKQQLSVLSEPAVKELEKTIDDLSGKYLPKE